MQVQLISANKSQKGQIFPIDVPAFRIGRAKDCHLRSDSSKVSRQHCVINIHDDTVKIVDLGSENGTFVNGKQIVTQQELKDGDELTVGRHSFVVSIKTDATQPVVSEDDILKLLSDSSVATPPPTPPPPSPSGIVDSLCDVVNEPLQVIQKETSFSDFRRSRETPLRRKTTFVDDNHTGQHTKIFGSVFVALCLLGFLGVWLMGETKNPYGAVHMIGTLTLDGEPIAGVSIILHPRDRDIGRVAGGITDSRGRFTVTTGTAPMANGAIPGEYDITFQKIEMEGTAPSMEALRPAPASGTSSPRNVQPPSKKHVIPQKYGNPKTSGLDPITVKPTGKNSFNFPLSSVVP